MGYALLRSKPKLFKRIPCRSSFKKLGGYPSLLAVALAAALALATVLALLARVAALLARAVAVAAARSAAHARLAHKIHSVSNVTRR